MVWKDFGLRLRALFFRHRMDDELEEELQFHIEMQARKNRGHEPDPAKAKRQARLQFGSVVRALEECRDARGISAIEILARDLRFALRMLRKSPSFSAIAVLTLGLGIGANTAIFTVINAILFRPLPVGSPKQLVNVYNSSSGEIFDHLPLAYPDYLDYRHNSKTLSGLIGFAPNFLALDNQGESEIITAEAVSTNYFDVLRVRPVLGRSFDDSNDLAANPYPAVVLSYNTWQRKFGADPAIIGKAVHLNGSLLTIVGVAPPGFSGLLRGLSPGLWLPVSMDPVLHLGDPVQDRGSQWLFVTGRLMPGVTSRQAQAELKTIAERLALQYPNSNKNRGAIVIPTNQVKILPEIDGALYAASFVVLAFVGLILLIACANIAGMLLARASIRKKEITLRLALGASRPRLVRQLLTESLLLSLLGGGLGLLLSGICDRMLSSALDSLHLVVPVQIGLGLRFDIRVFAFALLVVTFATLFFGLVPAFRASRVSLGSALKEDSGAASGGRSKHRALKLLVVGQVATSLLLLICAGLSLRSMENAFRVDPGFKPEGVITASFFPSFVGLGVPQAKNYYDELTSHVAQFPGVQSVSLAERLPLTFVIQVTTCAPESKDTGPSDKWQSVDRSGVGPGYFRTMQIPILRGREFSEQDNASSPLVVIVNQTLANLFWPGQDPIGKKVRFGGDEKYSEVVGVARDGKYRTLGELPRPYIYRPAIQQRNPDLTLVARVSGDTRPAFAAIRDYARQLDRDIPAMQLQPLEDRTSVSLLLPRTGAALFGVLGLLGMVLVAVGLYGVIAYTANQRTREIGIRMALGARPREILRLILRQGLALTIAGIGFGLATAFATTRLLSIMLYGISPTDALTFVGISLFLLLIALAASFVPARRAMRLDPMVALRHE